MNNQPTQNNSITSNNDPGKTLGIIGLILAFIGAGLVGLILSIIGYKKSKAVGIKNGIALAGIIINSVSLVIVTIFIILAVLATTSSYGGITAKANTAKSQSSAQTVASLADVYYADNYSYPETKISFDSSPSIILPSYITFDSLSKAPAPNAASQYVRYQTCASGDGYNVAYWDYATNKITASPITAGSQTNCVTVSN